MKGLKKYAGLICIAVLAALCLTGCGKAAKQVEPQGMAYFNYFDTVSYVYSYLGDSAEDFEKRSAETAGILEEYHRRFDIYHEYSGMNNLCTLNKNAGGQALEVDRELIDFLLYARELYERTGGEMNVMMGSVLRLWHDCRETARENPELASLPEQEALLEAAKHTAIESLEIDEENSTVRIADPKASIDVGALGKGYATEMAARHLEAQGIDSYVLNVGGNIRIIGAKVDGTGWVTGIKDPLEPDNQFAVNLRLKDVSCVTSGVYERYYTVNGERYHHIVDKDSLYPAEHFASLTVLTKHSGLADALSTALFCMDYQEGEKLVSSMEGVEVIWIFPDGELRFTPGVEELIEEN